MKEFLRDVTLGWRARPVSSLALAAVGACVGLLVAGGFRMWHRADSESRSLLAAWPADRTTLQPTAPLHPEEVSQLCSRLPPGEWWAEHLEQEILWVSGALPPELDPEEGTPLTPDVLHRGTAAALVSPDQGWSVEETGLHRDVVFRVWGIRPLPHSAELLLPWASRSSEPIPPDSLEIRLPANRVQPLIQDLPFASELSLLDHQQQRANARAGFFRLTRNLMLLGLAAALLTALILQALIRFELQERRTEFALRRSLGATPGTIRNQVLTETFATAGIPSIVGAALLLPLLPRSGVWLLLMLPGWFLLCALPPALRAARLPPHEALKEG